MKRLLPVFTFLLLSCTTLFAQGNLKAEYYNGTNFQEYVGTNYVDNLDFYWDWDAPIKGLNPNKCSVIYTGQLRTPESGEFSFSARVDDGIKVWIDDQLVISNWRLNDYGYSVGKIHLNADIYYDIRVEYFNALNEAEIRLLWQLPDDPDENWLSNWWYRAEPTVIPTKYFSAPVEEEIVEVPEQAPEPVLQPEPKPKEKVLPEPTPKKEAVFVKPAKRTIDTLQKYIPKNVEFPRAKSEILASSYPELDKLAAFLTTHPSRKVKIEGHTDNVGDSKENLILSEKRAMAIAAYLVKNGVHHKQILSAEGFGGSRPLVQSDGRKYHPENRRVEFIIE